MESTNTGYSWSTDLDSYRAQLEKQARLGQLNRGMIPYLVKHFRASRGFGEDNWNDSLPSGTFVENKGKIHFDGD